MSAPNTPSRENKMQEMLRRMRGKRAESDSGFTLIELLVVVVIIGILVAIAVPVYLNYRKGAANKSAQSDIRGAISAVEQYYTENGNVYPADQTGTVSTNMTFTAVGGTNETATVSPGNTLQLKNNTNSYVVCGENTDGGAIYVYNSVNGGSVKKSDQASLALCASTGH
jgi:type IV pilus assembly protein PilA